ncbi:MAG: glycosyltransferase family 2 protein [Phycisphaerae bacterium]|nr:glycosyltransferase family 2 protein [Gemmatimonadaceae bacterium]
MTTFVAVFAVLQTVVLAVLLIRLLPGRTRMPAVEPLINSNKPATVSLVVATLNEAARIAPCLEGLRAQGNAVLEFLFVDSNSTDGTREMIEAARVLDPRMQLLSDAPQPRDWIGKVWALETGRRHAKGEWILGIDADTVPAPGMVAGIVQAMERGRYDAASFGPRFIGQSPAERWLQPAMLMTLIYRCGAAGAKTVEPKRVLANGQCFMVRRALLEANGGYSIAQHSFSDDVTLARHLAQNGARVGFLNGRRIISVRAYRSAGEMWREWGRSFDLKDSTTATRRVSDVLFVWLTMALPLPVLIVATGALAQVIRSPVHTGLHIESSPLTLWLAALIGANAFLLCVRILLVYAIRGSYGERGWTFWMSWLADIPAAVRLTMSAMQRPRSWRGRQYT